MALSAVKSFKIDVAHRYGEARNSQWLVAGRFVTGLMIFLLGGGGLLIAGGLGMGGDAVSEWGMLLLSVAGLLLLMFTYGSTYKPHLLPPRTTTELLMADNDLSNVAETLTYRAVLTVAKAMERPHKDDLQVLFDQLLKDNALKDFLIRLELPEAQIKEAVATQVIPNLNAGQLAYTALSQAATRGRSYVDTIDLAGVFLLHPNLHTFWRQLNLREQDIAFNLWWQHTARDVNTAQRRWWDAANLLDFSGVGLSWAAGYTPFIDQFSRVPAGSLWDQPLGHQAEVEKLIIALARARQSNVLVVGHPGVGRLGVVKEVARRVRASQAHPALNGQRVVYIHVSQLVALGGSSAQQLSSVSRALDEMERAGNIIAILDGLSSILGVSSEGTINLSEVLQPFFSSQTIRVVAIMSSDDYHLRVKTDEELMQLFEVVEVPPLDDEMTLALLALTTNAWEKQYNVWIPYRTIKEIVDNTSSILPFVPFPEKAFDILEEAIVYAQGNKHTTISVDIIHYLIAQKVGINVGQLRANEQKHLLSLEDIIHQRVVNQQQGVTAVVRAMIRSRAGVRSAKKPIGTFLFLGPTGVGKTETAKALAAAFFGSEDSLQRLDMSEFQGADGLNRLIGGGTMSSGRLTSLIADHPFSVLLLDEFEKSDILVQQLFLPVLDEGYLTDALGRRYSFHHTIIIATSNAGAEFIRTHIGDSGKVPPDFNDQLREHILQQGLFRPETLNRFDGVITFTPLTPEHIKQVAGLMLRKLNKRLDAEQGITVAITDDLLNFLVKIGYDPEFGARPMTRAIQNTVEYIVAESIIRGNVQPGQQLTLSMAQLAAISTSAK